MPTATVRTSASRTAASSRSAAATATVRGIEGESAQNIDATGRVVTPGFVDVHTHYDGQVSWDDTLEPSSLHGVTTVVSGNCGVGFAPVRPGREQWLIELMEGVEDIPGTALAEGITWQWESFPEYLDAIEKRDLAVDYGTQVAHGAVRGYAMGERGARNEEATEDDIAAMARIVQEAVEAGALGFSTSRTEAHRAIDGEAVPGTYAAEAELFGLGRAMAAGGRAVFEVAPQGAAGETPAEATMRELDWMSEIADEIDRPVSFTMIQASHAPDLWRRQLERAGKAQENGIALYAQFAARPFGMLFGFEGYHAFTHRPTFRKLKAELDRAELAQRLADPAVRAAILSEADLPPDPTVLFDAIYAMVQFSTDRLYRLGSPPDYEPTPDQTVAAIAERRGQDPLATMYDLMLESDAGAMLMLPFFNYAEGNHDAIYEMMTHPAGGVRFVGRRCALRHDLRCVLPDLPAHPLGPRPSPRSEVLAGIRGAQADTGHRNTFRSVRPRRDPARQEGRLQRHRHGHPEPARAPDGLRPAGRRTPAGAGRDRIRRHGGQRRGDPPARRRHRCAARAADPRGALRAAETDEMV